MAGHSKGKRPTGREPVDLKPGSPVKIQEQRRFFNSRGGDRAIREAKAIANAFGVVTDFAIDGVRRSDARGKERATEQAGAGSKQDLEDQNPGYMREWNELGDRRDLRRAKTELPQLLEDMDAENKSEKVVQAAISQYMKDQWEGIDVENEDHTILAAGLLELETNLIADHRDFVIQQTQEVQRSDLFGEVQDLYDDSFERDADGNKVGTGSFPYQYAGEKTNVFFDGPQKRVVYWEMIYQIAIENGDPDIIRNVPERFASGDPTGINDPNLLKEHRAAIRSATIKQASNALLRNDAKDDANDSLRFGVFMQMWDVLQHGGDIDPLIKAMAGIPGTEGSDLATAAAFAETRLSKKNTYSSNLDFGVTMWANIFSGVAGPGNVLDAYSIGLLGTGPQSKEEAKKMLSSIQSVRNAGASNRTRDVTEWRSIVNNQYNARTGGLFEGINPVMARINIDANSMYLELTQSGTPAREASVKVFEKFDPMVDSLPPLSSEELEGRRSQANFTGTTSVSMSVIKAILDGDLSVNDAFTGVPNFVIEDRLMDEIDAGNITQEEAISIAQQL